MPFFAFPFAPLRISASVKLPISESSTCSLPGSTVIWPTSAGLMLVGSRPSSGRSASISNPSDDSGIAASGLPSRAGFCKRSAYSASMSSGLMSISWSFGRTAKRSTSSSKDLVSTGGLMTSSGARFVSLSIGGISTCRTSMDWVLISSVDWMPNTIFIRSSAKKTLRCSRIETSIAAATHQPKWS